eukprot:COSAG05_NODE_16462_length_345_cov_1.272358_1_plen_91_part_01
MGQAGRNKLHSQMVHRYGADLPSARAQSPYVELKKSVKMRSQRPPTPVVCNRTRPAIHAKLRLQVQRGSSESGMPCGICAPGLGLVTRDVG